MSKSKKCDLTFVLKIDIDYLNTISFEDSSKSKDTSVSDSKYNSKGDVMSLTPLQSSKPDSVKNYFSSVAKNNTDKGDKGDKVKDNYNMDFENIGSNKSPKKENITSIGDIISSCDNKPLLENITTIITMQDYLSGDFLPKNTDICCFWCRHQFEGIPLGCPITYKNNQIEKNYYSEITKDNYIIKENIDNDRFKITKNNISFPDYKTKGIKLVEKNYFISDGIFCSFNCCLAFINDNKGNSLYDNSKSLLLHIYHNIGGSVDELIPAPSWRLLKVYGGQLSIEHFRKSSSTNLYKQINVIYDMPKFKPIGFYFTSSIVSNSY